MKEKSTRNRIGKLSLFHKATIVMSLMSWYTTYNGFKNSVFANGQGLIAGLASMAIQVILLGGVLFIFPISKMIWDGIVKTVKELWENRSTLKALKEVFKRLFMTAAIWGIFALAMVTSITFSYIAIVNDVYETDFAVNANIKLDGFMRDTIQKMETDNKKYLDEMRSGLIEKLKADGETIIKESARKRGNDYAKTTAKLLSLMPTKELVSLDKTIEKFDKHGLLKDVNGNIKYYYRSIKKSYADKLYGDFIRSQEKENNDLKNTQFSKGLKEKINNINRDKYASYGEYHYEYLFAVKQYNKWIQTLAKGQDAPTLEQMKNLYGFCETIKTGVDDLLDRIARIDTSHAEEHTKRLITEATMNMDSLVLAVGNICEKTDKLIENTYGKDRFSFEELISVFGSSETKLDDLNNARKQLLEMQGALLSSAQATADTITDVTQLMHELEDYIDAVKYSSRLQSLKLRANTNYNIVKTVDLQDADSQQRKDMIYAVSGGAVEEETEAAATGEAATGAAATEAAATGAAVSAEAQKEIVIDVTSEEWTEVKKSQMSELEGLISGHPVYLYWPHEKRGESIIGKENEKSDYEKIYKVYSSDAVKHRKSFLDTSEMEKANNLIRGDGNYFPYNGKAIMSLVFAIFLDFGAFMLGMVMFFTKSNQKRN